MLLRMNSTAGRRYFILSIWSQPSVSTPGVWRGYVESASGARTYFATLQQLNALLQSVGWLDATAVPNPDQS
jgi:hypothetical protein